MTDLSSTTRLPGFEEAYRAESRRLFVERARFLLWSALVLAVLCGLIVATDQGINLAMHEPSRELIGPLFFLLGSSVFTGLATVSSRRTRRRDLSLRLRLERANEDLKELDEAK